VFTLIVASVIALAPILTKGREVRVPAWLQNLAHAGYVLLFVLSVMHLTNMRITPLIYFKF
jgi:hypothetical protein